MPGEAVDARIVREFWEQKSREERNRWTSEEMLAYELELLRKVAPQPASILDLGSGHGHLSRPLAGAEARLVAVDFAAGYGRSFDGPNHEFVAASLAEFKTSETFDLVLLFGVVTSIDEADELPLYRRMAGWLAEGGTAVVKNQCANEESFVVTGYSDALGADYSGRYPLADEQEGRLRQTFSEVETIAYPDRFNPWANSRHVAFICRRD